MEKQYDLADRLTVLAADVVRFSKGLSGLIGTYYGKRIVRTIAQSVQYYSMAYTSEQLGYSGGVASCLRSLKESKATMRILFRDGWGTSDERKALLEDMDAAIAQVAALWSGEAMRA